MGQGKFSTKKVKILCYQKTDHNVWLAETAFKRAEEEELALRRKMSYEAKVAEKEAKLSGAQKRQQERRDRLKREATMKFEEEER